MLKKGVVVKREEWVMGNVWKGTLSKLIYIKKYIVFFKIKDYFICPACFTNILRKRQYE